MALGATLIGPAHVAIDPHPAAKESGGRVRLSGLYYGFVGLGAPYVATPFLVPFPGDVCFSSVPESGRLQRIALGGD